LRIIIVFVGQARKGPKLMEIKCENCGKIITIQGLGRKRLNIPVKIVCDALQAYPTVGRAAENLGCSRPYIYKVLKQNNLKASEIVTKGKIKIKEAK